MPYMYVDADLVLEYKDVKIYYVYQDDNVDHAVMSFWYSLKPDSSECDDDNIDVRDLANELGIDVGQYEPLDILKLAIDRGILVPKKEED